MDTNFSVRIQFSALQAKIWEFWKAMKSARSSLLPIILNPLNSLVQTTVAENRKALKSKSWKSNPRARKIQHFSAADENLLNFGRPSHQISSFFSAAGENFLNFSRPSSKKIHFLCYGRISEKIMDENLDNIEDFVSLSQYRFSARNGPRISVSVSRPRMKKPRPILEKSRESRYRSRYRSRPVQL